VSAAWPLLYAANRAVVGADPDLIRPGERLSLPAHLEERTTR
jgi:nucleoid-associated protein YgaU